MFETHLHNDYVSGGLALARATGAAYHVNAADRVAFDRTAVRDRDVVEVRPAMRVRVIATPGHTFTHLSYALEDARPARPSRCSPAARCCTARPGAPDLLGAEHRPSWPPRSTARPGGWPRLLPPAAGLYPTHGFGSFCAADASPAAPGRPSATSGAPTRP